MLPPTKFEDLHSIANEVKSSLENLGLKCVFAESCTGGMVAAAMATVPGVSGFLCGSAVTYRESAKSLWLGVDAELLAQHSAESMETTVAMAESVLERTSEADIAVAVTGHLGPGAAAEKDGVIFFALAQKHRPTLSKRIQLSQQDRCQRQVEAAGETLNFLLAEIRVPQI